ncbi:PD-(D/E)XK nuclease family protein [Acinetobacter sp. YH12233]|uniref:PD-(D/E)XK nuclease family protein n=1 Tax=Acinetobacter sp. YH12233 TaxID=2601161 RepID=UPI0015D178FA|nr:PD-(D/E)XK nuclease family protein [Acinetobacter sp. YH12233]
MSELKLKELEKLLSQAKNYKLDLREKNFFETGARGHYENPTTDVLAFFLNPEEPHNLSHIFLDALISCFPQASQALHFEEVICVKREVPVLKETNTYARIDLFIETTTSIFVIECKIYHHQNDNPFGLYKNYAEQRAQNTPTNKKVYCGVLCLDGFTHETDWQGISYRKLVQELKPRLAQDTFNQPFNKWMMFAREFILLLESYYQMNINTENLNFILNNAQAIEDLINLREKTFDSLHEYIGNFIQNELNGKFIYKKSDEHNNHKKEFWFANSRLAPNNWSATTLEIKDYNSSPSFKLNIYLLINSNMDTNKLKEKFPAFDLLLSNENYQWENKQYLKGQYSLSTLDLAAVSKICADASKTITEIYLENEKNCQPN